MDSNEGDAVDQGERLGGRYRLVDRIGAGGMGEVWRAVDEVLGRTVAVKTMLPSIMDDQGFGRRFLAEAKAMAALRHRGVVAIHDFHSGADGAFLVMEYVESESLAQVLNRTGRLGWAATLDLVAQAADALQAAHTAGLVHRDVKPANLLVRPDGSLVLTDFGIARLADQTSLTTAGAVLGTPSYLSPEQVLGQPATPLSDVYALGVVAYECLSGQRPFLGDNPYAIALQRVHDQPRTIVSDAPRAVLEVIETALATDLAHRWRSAADFAQAARAAAASAAVHPAIPRQADPGPRERAAPAVGRVAVPGIPTPGGHTPPGTPTPGGPVRAPLHKRRQALAAPLALGLLAVALLGGGSAWYFSRSPGGADPGSSPANGSPTNGSPADMAACGGLYCPTKPMCWSGFVVNAGHAQPLGRLDCAAEHRWETFLAAKLPADAVDARQDALIKRPDIAAVCSSAKLKERSREPAQTSGWNLDAWPVQQADKSWFYYCMTASPDGEVTGTVVRTAG